MDFENTETVEILLPNDCGEIVSIKQHFKFVRDLRVICPECGSNCCTSNLIFFVEENDYAISVAVDRYRFDIMIESVCEVQHGTIQNYNQLPTFFKQSIEEKDWAEFSNPISEKLKIEEVKKSLEFLGNNNVNDTDLFEALIQLVNVAEKKKTGLRVREE